MMMAMVAAMVVVMVKAMENNICLAMLRCSEHPCLSPWSRYPPNPLTPCTPPRLCNARRAL